MQQNNWQFGKSIADRRELPLAVDRSPFSDPNSDSETERKTAQRLAEIGDRKILGFLTQSTGCPGANVLATMMLRCLSGPS